MCVGIPCIKLYILITAGESGLVYKAYLNTAVGKELVAVKTGKGSSFVCYASASSSEFTIYFLHHSNRVFTSW